MVGDLLAIVVPAWVAGSILTFWCLMLIRDDADFESHEIVWWPLTIAKFLFRTLWRALTEGWKP